jgi:myxalamid-type polyketide synthase MxaE and MxaD
MRASGLEAVSVTLEAVGRDVRSAQAEDLLQRELVSVIHALLPEGGALGGVVHLWSLDLPDVEAIESPRVDAAMVDGCDSVLSLLRAVEEVFPETPTPVWFVTRGGQPWALTSPQMAPLQAPLWGIARAAAAELPSRWGGLIDLDPGASVWDSAAALWDWVREARKDEDEVLFRHGEIYGGRLVRRASFETPRPITIRPDASYLVTGGTGGLGLAVAHWLAARGAKHLVLASRTPVAPRDTWASVSNTSPAAETIEALRKIEGLGATVHTVSIDIANSTALLEYLNQHERQSLPPIRGVLHLAGTVHLEDLLRVDAAKLLDAVRPKIHGSLALHRWIEDLDFLVLFSSASSVIRSPRLGHYAAGNAFLDAMAHYRRGRNQPAISIDWGLWSDVGFIRRLGDRGPGAMRGMKSIAPEAGIRLLEHLMGSNDVQAVVWPPDWRQWAQLYPDFARTSFISQLLGAAPAAEPPAAPPRTTFRAVLSESPDAERPAAIRAYVVREIAERLRLAIADLPLDVPLERLGFDSLQATELQAKLHVELGVRMPVMRFLGFSSAQAIADEVVERFATQSLMPSRPSAKPTFQPPAGEANGQEPHVALDADVLKRLGT